MDWNNAEEVEIYFLGIVALLKTRVLLLQDDPTNLEKNI